MRVFDSDVFNERDFFQDIFIFIPFVLAAINDGKREILPMFKQNHDGHGKQSIDLPCDVAQFRPAVLVLGKRNGKKQIGFNNGLIDFFRIKQGYLLADFLLGKLKKKIDILPVFYPGFFFIEF